MCLLFCSGWTLSVTKHPCQDNGVFEFVCCRENTTAVILDIKEATSGQTIASTDFNGFQVFDKSVYPDYDISSDSICLTFTINNFPVNALSFTCTMGSHILTTSAAPCSVVHGGTQSALTSTSNCSNIERDVFIGLFAVFVGIALVLGIIVLILCIQEKKCPCQRR